MIHIKNICLSFGHQDIFDNISCTINSSDKIGLVGANGTGKSTLLKIIAKQQSVDSGSVAHTTKKIGYLPQEVVLTSTKTILEYVVESIKIDDETQIEAEKAEAKKILMGLGFSLKQMEQSIPTLSIGWKMRLLLGQLLIQKADFYLLDEPTNHLDIVTKQWLLKFLQRASFGYILVSHDKYFLNRACLKILELENANLIVYQGNYDLHKQQKEERLKIEFAAYEQQQKEISRKKRTIERFRAKATKAKMAQSMEKSLAKIELIKAPQSQQKISFSFPQPTTANRIVLQVNAVAHSFENKKIFESVNFEIERREKIALVAANGIGKTTLLSLVSGSLKLQQGSILVGDKVQLGIFEQNQDVALDTEKTVLETIQDGTQAITTKEIRSLLGSFMFSGDTVDKKVGVLSGGEKNRISMLKILVHNNNMLILDEPTNHLDIQSKEVLLEALKKYTGTILFVSHDQDFINRLATKIIELSQNGTRVYQGNYDDYLSQKDPQEEDKKRTKKNTTSSQKGQFEQRKELRRLENKIEKTEKKIKKLSDELETLTYGTYEFDKTYKILLEKQKTCQEDLKEWETLHDA
ncbi:ABC-F family ATP-binding cassette domain-containing protein [bacterium]|jgi:ATP-binding cassette, subfamily F, member 3|nr:ABC-F family ATP-binding cassette domain-containing protein [bacterium]